MDFQKFTADALRANYSDDWFDERPSLRIVTEVVNRNEKFAKTLERHGLSYQFKNVEERMHPEESDAGSEFADDHPADVEEKEIPGDELSIRTTENHPDLEEVMFDKDTISKKIGKDTLGWLKTVYTTSRGTELGTFDPSILATTMKTQSSKWEALALCYISDIVSMVHTFIIDLLKLICPDARVRDELMSVLMEDLMAKYKTAFDHVLFLLRVERLGTPATLNHYFNDNLEKRFVICFHTLCSFLAC